MGTSRVLFKRAAFYNRFPASKTSRWHLNRLDRIEDIEDWIADGPESYRIPRLFLAQNISRYTRGFTREDTRDFTRRAHELVAAEIGSA